MQTNIFTWALLNFIGLNIENLSRIIGNTKRYNQFQTKYLSSWNRRRLNCALASILLAMSAISNFFFFAGQEIGNIYINRILKGKYYIFPPCIIIISVFKKVIIKIFYVDSWNTILLLLFFLYCCCHVSIDIKLMGM